MTIIALALGRAQGRILDNAVSWATMLLFGRLTPRTQLVLFLLCLGALVWVALVVGLPTLGRLLDLAGTILVATDLVMGGGAVVGQTQRQRTPVIRERRGHPSFLGR